MSETPDDGAPTGARTCPYGHPATEADRFCTICGLPIAPVGSAAPDGLLPAADTVRHGLRAPTIVIGVAVLVLVIGGVVAAVLVFGTSGEQGTVPVAQAVANTLAASGFTEQLDETTPSGDETAELVYGAPDRLGGSLVSAGRRTYLVVIGKTEYISTAQVAADRKVPHTYYMQATTSASEIDPAHTYLPYFSKGTAHVSGAITTVTLHSGSQTDSLSYTVTGAYVSIFRAKTPAGTITLDIRAVGSAPAVSLPARYHVVSGSPPTSPDGPSG